MIRIMVQSTGRNSLRGPSRLFNIDHETVIDAKEAQEFLVERYGKMPGGKNKIYVDDKDGNTKVIGFTHSFWNSDISHNSKPWYQTDWIVAVTVVETPISILP